MDPAEATTHRTRDRASATASRIAVYAAVAACVAWGLKALVIWNAGGLDESRFEGPLFGLGLLSIVVAFVALGVSLAPRSGLGWKVLAGAGGVAAGVFLALLVENVVGGAMPDSAGWVREEAGLWVAGALALALTVFRLRRVQPG